ncbi:MAG: NADH-quinone oxidoreductase subunit L, partial [Actinomycetota bacterium]
VVHGAEADIKGTWAYDNKWWLLVLAILVASAGIAASIAVYSRGKARPIEPTLLAEGWRYDSAVSAVVGGPGRAAFQAVADADAGIVDGAVNGTGRAVLSLSTLVRRAQTGFVRGYAAIIGAGAVLVLAWFLWRGWM